MNGAEEGTFLGGAFFKILLFLMVIGVLIAIVTVALLNMNKQQTAFSSQLESADDLKYSEYKNATVDGSKVVALAKQYATSKDFGIVTLTKADSNASAALKHEPGTGTINISNAYTLVAGTTAWNVGKKMCVGTSSTATNIQLVCGKTGDWYVSSGADTSTKTGVKTEPSAEEVNGDVGPLTNRTVFGATTITSKVFINTSDQYYCQLIRDAAGNNVIGILATQVK